MALWIRRACVAAVVATTTTAADSNTGVTHADILHELREIRKLLELQVNRSPTLSPPGRPVASKIDLRGRPFLGSKDASYTMVLFTDYECGFCQRFFQVTFPKLKEEYIDTGKIRFYVKDFPLQGHQKALLAAQATRCAEDQGQFWPMHDRIQTGKLDRGDFLTHASDAGLDMAKFRQCLDEEQHKEAILQSAREAMAAGATGTPSFVFGKSTDTGVEGELIVGALPFDLFEQRLKSGMR